MNDREAIDRIKNHMKVHKIGVYPHVVLAEALELAISALQEREERSKGCRFCLDAGIDPDLEGCDLSYHDVGHAEKWHRIMIRSGAGKPMAVMYEKWSGKQWNTVGIYAPKFCPECGRNLKTVMPEEEV